MTTKARSQLKRATILLAAAVWPWATGALADPQTPSRASATKYAVCVGIDNYKEISSLHGCVNDSKYMETNLVLRGKWPSANVKRLNDSQATKQAIRKAISNAAAKAVSGDTFVFMQSSHGGQYYGGSDILTGESGKAVYLCVYDEDYDDNRTAYNDYELAADLASFRSGVKVAVIVDACHSGGLFKSAARAKAAAAEFDLAERVSALMDAKRAERKARGEAVEKGLSSSEIGWATAAEYYELSQDGGFYHTDAWLTDAWYGYEYSYPNYPSSYKLGGVFMASATWGWWNGDADLNATAGDGDGYCDAYEFWRAGYEYCSGERDFHPQCKNSGVLRSIELGYSGANAPPAAPGAPSVSIATYGAYADASSITVTWTGGSGATSFDLYRSTTATRPGNAYKTGVTSPYRDTDSGLVPGVKYYYWVAAKNAGGTTFSSADWGNRAVTLSLGSAGSVSAAGGGKSFSVSANTSWSASTGDSWISLGGASGSGNGTCRFTVAANGSARARTGKIVVTAGGGTAYPKRVTNTVSQAGSTDPVLVLGASERTFGAGAAGGKELSVKAKGSWTAKSSVSWVTLKTKSGKGDGKVVYGVGENGGTATRTGKITVTCGDVAETFTVKQSGSPALTLGASERTFGAGGGGGKELSVKAKGSWTAKSSVSWVTLKTKSGKGNGKVVYGVGENGNSSSRTGKITVSGGVQTAVFTIRQDGKKVVLEVPAEERAFGSGAQKSKECKVKANVSWTATPSEPWIKLAKSAGKGNGTVVYHVEKNPGARRTAAITVKGGGKTAKYRIVQDAQKRANKKFALCVGVGSYSSGLSSLNGARNDAEYFADNLASRGGGWSIWRRTDYGATKRSIRAALTNIAAQTIPGDTVVFFQSSRGNGNEAGTSYWLCATDGKYWDTELAADLGKFPSGVKLVVLLHAGHDGGMIQRSPAASAFPMAERVAAIMGEERGGIDGGARGFVDKIRFDEIGWVTSCTSGEVSYMDGYYDTGRWLDGGDAGTVKGALFFSAFTWGWWYGEADAQGDGDGRFDAYEGYLFAKPHCEGHDPAYHPQCHNPDVLRSVELGSCGRADLEFYRPSGWPAAVFVTTRETYTGQQTSFTAGGSTRPCIRYAWHNASSSRVTATGTAARAYTVRFEITGPESYSENERRKNLMPLTYATQYHYYGLSNGGGVYAAPTTPGRYTAWITLDAKDEVTESDEGDNTTSVTFTVVSGRGTKQGNPEASKKDGGAAMPEGADGGERAGEVAESEAWVAVTTSDGEDGGAVLDGDEETGWGPAGPDGGWVVLSYSEALDVKGVEVKGEGLPEEGVRVLVSEDADEWREECEGRAQYVWVILPEGAEGARVTEIAVVER